MKYFFSFLLVCIFNICFGQVKQLSSLPQYDCSLKTLMNIISKPTILLIPDENKSLQSIIDEYCGDLGNNCVKKTVSEINDTDYLKPIFVVGEINKLKNWMKLNLPVQKIENGFKINDKTFVDSSDGFAFIDSNRIVVSGNSVNALKDVQLAFTGGYAITVLEKGKITFFGNQQSENFDWYNLQNLKTVNYNEKKSALFSAIYISKTFHDTIDFNETESELKKYAAQFLSIYKIPMPTKKIVWFVHSNLQEFGMMSGMFGLTCPENNSAGFSIRGEIHTNGYNLPLVKHEYSHFLFDNSIPQDNNPAFFVEGCVEYVTNMNDSALYNKRLIVAEQYRDSLNYTDLIINNKDFYGQFSNANYSVCGVVVKYLIDNFGVDKFKKYCLIGNKMVTTKSIYGFEFSELINEYKSWLNKQNDR